jgi:hypothetical protein
MTSPSLTALIATWRKQAEHYQERAENARVDDLSRGECIGLAAARRKDADELERALAEQPADPYAVVEEWFGAPGRCQWHDTAFVETIPQRSPRQFFCVLCANERRPAQPPVSDERLRAYVQHQPGCTKLWKDWASPEDRAILQRTKMKDYGATLQRLKAKAPHNVCNCGLDTLLSENPR